MHTGLDRAERQPLFVRYRLVGFSKYVAQDDDPAGLFLQGPDGVLDDLPQLFFSSSRCGSPLVSAS